MRELRVTRVMRFVERSNAEIRMRCQRVKAAARKVAKIYGKIEVLTSEIEATRMSGQRKPRELDTVEFVEKSNRDITALCTKAKEASELCAAAYMK